MDKIKTEILNNRDLFLNKFLELNGITRHFNTVKQSADFYNFIDKNINIVIKFKDLGEKTIHDITLKESIKCNDGFKYILNESQQIDITSYFHEDKDFYLLGTINFSSINIQNLLKYINESNFIPSSEKNIDSIFILDKNYVFDHSYSKSQ